MRSPQMNRGLLFLLLSLGVAGCATPRQFQSSSGGTLWHRNQEGFITSGVSPKDLSIEWISELNADGSTTSRSIDRPQTEVLDPLEDLPEFKRAFVDANRQASRKVKVLDGQLGQIFAFWREKKRILREKYQIDWKSPEDLNPDTHYD
jgi:hypothetical protein